MLNDPGTADLHTHTRRSDGLLTPSDLVRQAAAAGLRWVALTDHDSVAGVAEALVAAGASDALTLIPGIELSVRDAAAPPGARNDHHLLAYFVDPEAPALTEYLARLQETRKQMALETMDRLAQLGVPVSPLRVSELAEGAVVTRPHIARAMVEAGHVPSEREAFNRFLANGRPAAPERPAPSPEAAIWVVQQAGGVVGLAHPVFSQDATWAEQLSHIPALLDRLVEAGLAAVECAYPDGTPAISDTLRDWVRQRRLVATGGSDYHGPGKAPFAPLGTAAVGGDVVDALVASAGASRLRR